MELCVLWTMEFFSLSGYKCFHIGKEKRGDGVAQYVRECFDCLELDEGFG